MTRRRRPVVVEIPDDPALLPDYLDARAANPVPLEGDGWHQPPMLPDPDTGEAG